MSVQVRRVTSGGGTDPFGNPIPEETETFDLPGASVAPVTSSDVDPRGRSGVVVGHNLYVTDPDADVRRGDTILWGGEEWEIDGDIGRYRSPFGPLVDGVQAALKRGEG